MKLSEMKQILAAGEIRLTKSLGQNFLHDANQLRRILRMAGLAPTDRVLEIGPGLGPLTELLLETAGEVLAIETDQRLVAVLRARFANSPGLTLHHDDALRFLREEGRDWTDWKLVANLPYSAASLLLTELALGRTCPERLVVTLQREVVQRLLAQPGDDDYGALTLIVRLCYEPAGWFPIAPGCFFPTPDVDSACICLDRRATPLLPSEACPHFAALLKQSFSQRRKMLFKLLRADWPVEQLEAAFQKLGLSQHVRAEALGLEEFVGLTKLLFP